jgi:hypothetical protein
MARASTSEVVAKWQSRTKAASPDYIAGVNRVTEAPGAAAARQAGLMLANLMASINSGEWAAAVAAVPLSVWKDAAVKKGAQRIAAGVDGATPQMQQIFTELLARVDAAVAEVNQTPRGDLETNIQRMATFARAMAKGNK